MSRVHAGGLGSPDRYRANADYSRKDVVEDPVSRRQLGQPKCGWIELTSAFAPSPVWNDGLDHWSGQCPSGTLT